jgi:putative oxidoreductase
MTDILLLIGRLLFGGLFLYNGLNHFINRAGMTGYAAYKGVPMAGVSIVASGAWLVIAGLSVMLGFRPEIGLVMTALFLAGVTPVMHNFWVATDPNARLADMINFHKNMALLGAALMMLALPRPWPFAIG